MVNGKLAIPEYRDFDLVIVDERQRYEESEAASALDF